MIIAQAVAEFTPYTLADCRDRFGGTDLCRNAKESSLTDPRAFDLDEVNIPKQRDMRWVFE
jgi:hypothetical protein